MHQIKYISSTINTTSIIEYFDEIPLQLQFSVAQPYPLLLDSRFFWNIPSKTLHMVQ